MTKHSLSIYVWVAFEITSLNDKQGSDGFCGSLKCANW